MEFEDAGVVGLRVSLLFLTILFGLPGNIVAMCLKTRSFKQQGANAIGYVHLAFVDLMLCVFHAPLAIGLELCGYFSLKNDIGYELRRILFVLNKQVSLRAFAFTSITSQLTLAFIALFRCWRMFRPFASAKKSVMISMLIIPDAFTLAFIFLAQKVPSMYYELKNNSTETNSTLNRLQRVWTLQGLTQSDESLSGRRDGFNISFHKTEEPSSGETKTEDHGLFEPLLVYVTLSNVVLLTLCYSVISIKIYKTYRRLTESVSGSSTKNQAQRNFLSRQVSHVKTQFILILTLLITAMPTLVIALLGFRPSYAVLRVRSTVVALGSAINPYVYCLLTAESRRATMQLFARRHRQPDCKVTTISKTTQL